MKLIIILIALVQLTAAQLIIELKPEKDQYVAHEDVHVILSITNRAGKALTLRGEKRLNWLDINVTNQAGEILPYKGGIPAFKAAVIASGQTIKKKIPLNDFYDLTRYGRYQATAYVKLPGEVKNAIKSNSTQFLVTTGRTLFSQRVGLPNTGNARRYEVIIFNGSRISEIYVKITNEYSGQVIHCEALSPIVTFKEPQGSLDKQNNLHLLYLIKPNTYVHNVMTPSGKLVKRQYHKQGSLGEPRLESFANGDVKVAGTIPYDPVKEKKEIDQRKKLSDRPKLVF